MKIKKKLRFHPNSLELQNTCGLSNLSIDCRRENSSFMPALPLLFPLSKEHCCINVGGGESPMQ